jgi:hypothetical protein
MLGVCQCASSKGGAPLTIVRGRWPATAGVSEPTEEVISKVTYRDAVNAICALAKELLGLGSADDPHRLVRREACGLGLAPVLDKVALRDHPLPVRELRGRISDDEEGAVPQVQPVEDRPA